LGGFSQRRQDWLGIARGREAGSLTP